MIGESMSRAAADLPEDPAELRRFAATLAAEAKQPAFSMIVRSSKRHGGVSTNSFNPHTSLLPRLGQE
jgi:hypothetical protein